VVQQEHGSKTEAVPHEREELDDGGGWLLARVHLGRVRRMRSESAQLEMSDYRLKNEKRPRLRLESLGRSRLLRTF